MDKSATKEKTKCLVQNSKKINSHGIDCNYRSSANMKNTSKIGSTRFSGESV